MKIIDLDDYRKVWSTGAAACAACGHEWQAVYPIGAEDVGLECPACGSGLGSVLPSKDIVKRLRRWSPEESTHELHEDAADEIERLQKNAKQDAQYLLAYHRICQKHGIAPSSSELIAALGEKE